MTADSRPARHPTFGLALFSGLRPIDRSRLPVDIIAGATLAALAIPEVMGYTKIAGTPVITGLYTLLLPVFAFAVLGSSRHLVVGADSATAAILATGLLATGAVAGSPEYVALASLAALMCGVALLIARLLRLGFIANFLSRSVLIGFLTGVGIQVAMGQLGGMFGVSEGSGTTLEKLAHTLAAIPTQTSVPTLIVSLAVLGLIVGLDRVNKAIPGALIAVVGAIVASATLDLAAKGVTTLGTVPGGLPSLSLPSDVITTANVAALIPTVVSIFVVILAQSAATSRAYAMKYNDGFDENVDLVGLSAANVAAGFTGTFVVNGSPTKTEMVDSAGGRSQVSQVTCGLIVIAVLLFLTGPLAYMPNAVLSAVVFLIGIRLVDLKGMADVARLRRGEFAVAAATATTVVVIGVEQGIILAMALSILEHVYHSYKPSDHVLGLGPDGLPNVAAVGSGVQLAPGLVVYRFGASLYYANTARFTEEVVRIAEDADPRLRWLAITASVIADVDYQGSQAIASVKDELDRLGVTLVLCDVEPEVRAQLDAYGLSASIGPERIFASVSEMLAAYRSSE